jgi:hypothetical protein
MPFLGLGRGGDVVVGWPVSETPELRPQASQRCSETPLCEASDEAGRWTGLLTHLLEAQQGRIQLVGLFS